MHLGFNTTDHKKSGTCRSTSLSFYKAMKSLVPQAVHEGAQLARTRGVAQLAQRLGLDLPDAFTCNRERLANFFQGVLAAIFQSEAHFDHALFARAQRAHN